MEPPKAEQKYKSNLDEKNRRNDTPDRIWYCPEQELEKEQQKSLYFRWTLVFWRGAWPPVISVAARS